MLMVCCYYNNTKRHTPHTIASWPNPKQWVIVHTTMIQYKTCNICRGCNLKFFIKFEWHTRSADSCFNSETFMTRDMCFLTGVFQTGLNFVWCVQEMIQQWSFTYKSKWQSHLLVPKNLVQFNRKSRYYKIMKWKNMHQWNSKYRQKSIYRTFASLALTFSR